MLVIRFCGFGGQGVVLAARLLGMASAEGGKYVVQTQSYGSASRGGASKADVSISDEPIYDLSPDGVDVLVAMSQPAYEEHVRFLRRKGLLVYDTSLVSSGWRGDSYSVDAARFCRKSFGQALFANMLLLGFVASITSVVGVNTLKRTIKKRIRHEVEGNISALDAGYRLGRELKKSR